MYETDEQKKKRWKNYALIAATTIATLAIYTIGYNKGFSMGNLKVDLFLQPTKNEKFI